MDSKEKVADEDKWGKQGVEVFREMLCKMKYSSTEPCVVRKISSVISMAVAAAAASL